MFVQFLLSLREVRNRVAQGLKKNKTLVERILIPSTTHNSADVNFTYPWRTLLDQKNGTQKLFGLVGYFKVLMIKIWIFNMC